MPARRRLRRPPGLECDSPGPLGGLYEGVFHIDGTYSVFGVPGAVTCDAPVSIVVDASGDPTVHGAGDARCELSVVNVDGFALAPMSGVATGTLDGTTINATLHVGTLTLSGLVGAIAVGDDGVPTGMSGTGSGAIPKSELLAVTSGDLRAAISAGGASSAPYTTTFWATHKRVDGTCCGPAPIGCEPSDDTSCNARGWTFAAAGAGRCCDDTSCSPLTERACATLGLDYVPSGLGACCLESGCEAIPGVLCEQLGGTFANAGSCADGNDDGFSDVCGPPPTYGYDAPPGCALDGDTLTVNVGGVVDLAFESDAWTLDGATYSAGTRLGLQTPLGTVEIPDVTDFDVSCGQPFGILGRIVSPPSFAGIDAFASLGATTSAPDLSVGYGFGYQLADLGIDAPFADARPYFFAHAERGVELAISDAVAVRLSEGDNFDVLVDPDDPAVIFSVGGDSLHHGTGGLVKQVGIGLSYNGNLTLRSKRDLWNGSTFGPFVATGHVYRAGEFALIPLPGFEETNIYLDGDILVDVGSSVDLIEPIAKSLIEGDLGAIEDGLAAIGSQESVEDVVSEMSMAGNANSYKIEVGPLEVTVGSASWAWRDGTLTFSGEGLTPGAALASGDAGSLFKAFSSLTLQATGKVWGYVNSEGFSITTEADLVAGPFNLHDVRLIIDSHKGVRIEGGAFGFDLGAFLAQLETLMDCDFSASGASCSIGGIPIASLSGGLDDQGFRLAGSAGLPVLGSVAFSALIGDNGHFAFKGRASQGLPGFQTSDVEVVVTDHAFGITTGWSQFGQYISLSGTIGYDGSFELTGTGGLRVVGYQMSGATVTLSSETGLTAVGELSLLSFGKLRATLTVPPHIGDWSFQADGKLSVLGHELASVTASASSADGLTLFLDGEVGIAGAKARLTGSLSGANFSLTGTQELRIAGYTLTSASVTLSNTGLRVAGQLGIRGQGFALSGEVESNGDFAFHSTAGVAIPFGLISLSTSASFVKEGSSVQVIGQAVGSILGINFSSQFSYSSNGLFSWSAWVSAGGSVKLKICVPKPWGGHWCHYDTIGSLSGRAEMSINNNRASFHFKGSASAGGTTVASIDIPLSIDGTVCYRFPVIGRKCLKVL